MKETDKSSLVGILLIVGILIVFNMFFFEQPEQKKENVKTEELKTKNSKIEEDNKLQIPQDLENDNKQDSISNTEKTEILENNAVKITFSSTGGQIKSVTLKDHYSYQEYYKSRNKKSYNKKSLELYNNKDSEFYISGRGINTRNKKFKLTHVKKESITLTCYVKNLEINYKYTLTNDENLVNLTISARGDKTTQDLWLNWKIAGMQTEKSKSNQSYYTGIYYQYESDGDVDWVFENDDGEDPIDSKLSWIAFNQQFFTTIINAKNGFQKGTKLECNNENKEYIKTMSLQSKINTNEEYRYEIYFGPNDYKKLKSYKKGFEEVVWFGSGLIGWVNRVIVINIFDFIMNSLGINNFGLIILLLTLIIKFILSPLTYKSYLSQAKMKVLKPEIDIINEKHKSKDPMKAQQETMSLYRKAGVNPLGGCLPMLIQFPILIAMFRFFPASIELRQKSFLWADDLSSFDSIKALSWEAGNLPWLDSIYGNHISIFTLLMTVSTLIYTRMNSQMSSAQMPGMKWMMYLMPIMFLGFFNSYAAALTYYYFLANIFTFTQMYLMRRFIDENAILAQLEANKKKPKKKSNFQKKLEEMQKKQEQKMRNRKKRK